MTTGRPHSLLVKHYKVENPRTHGELTNGRAEHGCMACDEATEQVETARPA